METIKFGVENANEKISPQDQLKKALEAKYPELLLSSFEDEEALLAKSDAKEKYIDENNSITVLAELGIDCSRVELMPDGLYKVPIKSHFNTERLPSGYAYKGGAARALLHRALGIDIASEPRDVDIVRVTDQDPYEGADVELAKKYMADDFEQGYGVEVLSEEAQKTYFDTRDFTVNEALAYDDFILVTEDCLLDTARRVLKLTDFEAYQDGGPKQKLLAKMIRFYAEGVHTYGDMEIFPDDQYEVERSFIPPFYLALHLDRAFERGYIHAQEYVEQLKKFGQIPHNIETPEEAADYLNGLMHHDGFYYRNAPADQYEIEQEWVARYSFAHK